MKLVTMLPFTVVAVEYLVFRLKRSNPFRTLPYLAKGLEIVRKVEYRLAIPQEELVDSLRLRAILRYCPLVA